MLTKTMIARAWKDKEYRDSLSEEQRLALPKHPAGLIELKDEDLGAASGGYCSTARPRSCPSLICPI